MSRWNHPATHHAALSGRSVSAVAIVEGFQHSFDEPISLRWPLWRLVGITPELLSPDEHRRQQ
jgi:hypothetical protein